MFFCSAKVILRFRAVIFVLCASGIRALHEWYSCFARVVFAPSKTSLSPQTLHGARCSPNVSFVFSCRARKTKRAHLSIENKCAQTVGYINFCFTWANPRGIMASVPFVQVPTAKKFHFPSVAEILKIHNIILPQTSQNVKYFLLIPAPKFDNIFSFFRPAVSIFHKADLQDFSTVVFFLTARAIMRSIMRQISVPAA